MAAARPSSSGACEIWAPRLDWAMRRARDSTTPSSASRALKSSMARVSWAAAWLAVGWTCEGSSSCAWASGARARRVNTSLITVSVAWKRLDLDRRADGREELDVVRLRDHLHGHALGLDPAIAHRRAVLLPGDGIAARRPLPGEDGHGEVRL